MEQDRIEPQKQAENEQARRGGGPAVEALKPHQKILTHKAFVPSAVVMGLILVVLLSSRLTGRPPVVDSITPKIGKPGDVMIITGRYFGKERAGGVEISGISPTSGEYVDWTDTSISVAIPDEAGSGLVYVTTKNGRSRGLLFTNSDRIPVPVAGSSKPGEPYIDSVQPMAAHIGEAVTIKGKNFGLEQGDSKVYFTWAGGSKPGSGSAFDTVNMVPAQAYDLDYVSWSDIEIVLRVPDGAASGNIMVVSDKGRSNSQYVEVLAGAGMKFFPSSRAYSVRYGRSVTDVTAEKDSLLYVWMPHVVSCAEQRRVQLVSAEPAPFLGDHNGAALFALQGIEKGSLYSITMRYTFERYAVETQVTASKVPTYDTSSRRYAAFTSPDADIPSASPDIAKALPAILAGEKNPWLKAKRIYSFILATLTYSPSPRMDPVEALKAKKGDDFSYAALTCTLLRAAGIPSRIVAGYLVRDGGLPPLRHFWEEFYVDTVGWVPLDPLLADRYTMASLPAGAATDPEAYFFGNLDDLHVALSKGMAVMSRMNPQGKVKRETDVPFLFSFTEEASPGITAYRMLFEDLTEVQESY
jgi:hypothetical protein